MKIVFYDGECGVCNRLVQFLLECDRNHLLHFAPLQGETARQLLPAPIDFNTMAFSDDQKVYLRSDAALRMFISLGGKWNLLRVLLWIPKPLRDFAYNLFAKNRHALASAQCRVLTASERTLFLP